jgi:hypothetical protein
MVFLTFRANLSTKAMLAVLAPRAAMRSSADYTAAAGGKVRGLPHCAAWHTGCYSFQENVFHHEGTKITKKQGKSSFSSSLRGFLFLESYKTTERREN